MDNIKIESNLHRRHIIVKNWLTKEGYYNIKATSDFNYLKAETMNSRMIVVVGPNNMNKEVINTFAKDNQREAWVANVDLRNEQIQWELLV